MDPDGTRSFPLRRSRLAWIFVGLFAPGRHRATVGGGVMEVRVGLLGRARVPLDRVTRITSMRWPWWGGVGVRIARGMVAFVPASGDAVVLELAEELKVRAPFGWSTSRIAVAVEDVPGFAAALDAERARVAPPADGA